MIREKTTEINKRIFEYRQSNISLKDVENNIAKIQEISGVKKDSLLVDKVKDYISTLKDGSKYVFIDENLGKQVGLWKQKNGLNISGI